MASTVWKCVPADTHTFLRRAHHRTKHPLRSVLLSLMILACQTSSTLAQPATGTDQLVAGAYKLMTQGRHSDAVHSLRAAVIRAPNNILARRYLAHAALRAGQPALAIREFYSLASSPAATASDCAGLGDAYILNGDPARAIDAYRRALTIDAHCTEAGVGLVKACVLLEDWDAAATSCAGAMAVIKDKPINEHLRRMLIEIEQHKERQQNDSGHDHDPLAPG